MLMIALRLLTGCAALLLIAAAPPDQGRVGYVIDGDTFRLESGERIRIAGIDAPETHAGQAKCKAEIALGRAATGLPGYCSMAGLSRSCGPGAAIIARSRG